ncbi:MAG: asparagine synthase (glutamine-hydrolyzing) [Anaerolineales bacterium]|nr:asparagine synthase (glutamine-hydrolyzing) [Anaerolineales bacterium]MCB8936789.1 asparagine synthase (glutamine-hydrolyzing) [Ardenticatenaceae bacterium]
MCGIAGIHPLGLPEPVCPETLQKMVAMLHHRGPDESGLYFFADDLGSVGLGHARLSIIDLASGQQPLSNEDGMLWITFNGEIFNYRELRAELEADHEFATDSDTEVILHLYETYGPACVQHMNGQFVFAIWDEAEHSLFVARDRVGIRPFFYTICQNELIFASEMKAILAALPQPPTIDLTTLDQIFTYWSPLPPRTIFENIQTLPPGHFMVVRRGEIHLERYWQPEFPIEQNRAARTLPEAAAQLRHLLTEATRLRLRADVPVGAYLSGGLDSSTIAALLYHDIGQRLETFSIAFTDTAFDESSFQRQMAAHLGTEHHVITCTHEDVGRAFPDVIWHTETPILRTSPVPLFLLSDFVARAGIKVVLTGEGADEFLGGYNIFKEALIRRFWAREPASEIRPHLLKKLYSYVSNLDNPAYLSKFFGHRLTETAEPGYSHLLRWRNGARHRRMFAPEVQQAVGAEKPLPDLPLPSDFARWTPLAQAQFLEIHIFLAEYLLSSQGDRMAMAHSIEGRFPFLDHNVVEFCNQLPPDFKLRGMNEKHILKHAVRDLLPPEIWQRQKRPYRAPIHHSFFPQGRPLDWVAEMLSGQKIAEAGIFNPLAIDALQKKQARFGSLGEVDEMALAGILSTQLVHHHFVAGGGKLALSAAEVAVTQQPTANQKIIHRGQIGYERIGH